MRSFRFDQLGQEEETQCPWRWRKLAGQAIAVALANAPHLDALVRRMRDCGSFVEFYTYDVPGGVLRQLACGNFCRGRLCPACQVRRSRKLHSQLAEVIELYLNRHPTHQALLFTLTVENCAIEQLSDVIDQMTAAYRKFVRSKRVQGAVRTWWRTLEVTRNEETDQFHPHFHVLAMVPAAYFKRSSNLYISQAELCALWARCLGVNYAPIVDLRAVVGVGGGRLTDAGRKALREVTKYVTKASDLVKPKAETFFEDGVELAVGPEVIVQLQQALHGRRLVGMSRGFQELARELRQVDVDGPDADWSVAEALPEGAVYLGRERWSWDDRRRSFVLVAFFKDPMRREFG